MSDKKKILFLDRDGVINKRLIDDYVTKVDEFEFIPGVLEAIVKFNKVFDRVFIVTNQQGIAKGLMTEEDLSAIHRFMLETIESSGGKVDAVYYCPHFRNEGCSCRKPNTGMYLLALKDFSDIKDAQLFMVGDTSSDMQFAKNIGAVSVMISNQTENLSDNYNFVFVSLKKFADDIYLVLD